MAKKQEISPSLKNPSAHPSHVAAKNIRSLMDKNSSSKGKESEKKDKLPEKKESVVNKLKKKSSNKPKFRFKNHPKRGISFEVHEDISIENMIKLARDRQRDSNKSKQGFPKIPGRVAPIARDMEHTPEQKRARRIDREKEFGRLSEGTSGVSTMDASPRVSTKRVTSTKMGGTRTTKTIIRRTLKRPSAATTNDDGIIPAKKISGGNGEIAKRLNEKWATDRSDTRIHGKKTYASNMTKIDGHDVRVDFSGNDKGEYVANYMVNGSYFKEKPIEKHIGKQIISHVGKSINTFVRHMKPKSLTMSSKFDRNIGLHDHLSKRLARRFDGTIERKEGPELTHHTVKFKNRV
jgi:hypothetical protein